MSSGDWMCAACQHMNFKKRDACQRCHCPKFASSEEISSYGMNRTEVLAGDWYCATFNCGTHNYASRNACYRCGALKDYSAMMAASTASCYGYDASVVPGWKTGDWICNSIWNLRNDKVFGANVKDSALLGSTQSNSFLWLNSRRNSSKKLSCFIGIIPDELIQKQASEWALTLAGYFIGKRPAFPFVQYHARRMWKQFGLSEVILNDQAYFFFKFNSEQGLNFVLENGPWLFNGMPIFIQQWQPGLCFDKPEPKKVPLWVNIFGLPLDVWDFEIISYITSVVGEPISVDRYTEEMCETKASRANFARVLVNASADYELPTEIDAIILGKLRKFRTEFLWKPKRCSFCKVFGHDLTCCSFRPRTVEELNIDKPVPSSVGEPSKAKINQRFVPKTAIPSIDTIDKGKAIIGDDKPPPKVVKTERMTTRVEDNTNSKVQNLNTERIPIKVSNQFTVLEEHPKWTADKKKVDCYVEKRGMGLEPVIINSWSRQKLEYFIDRWERVFGKELDGKLRGFTLPDRIDVGDDDDDDTSDDDVLSDHDIVMDTRPKKVSWSDRQVITKMEQDTQ
ncbi:hypothetical protein OSB04_031683 [Centaurea solstitialis]|uniref:RanBP2-type domain-containing protein n=1 Tax=Centaurea solstitialis TaxID=347529 RepID=A0AA38SA05_9ASTR|nr:hypothetical protein OSB04_031683 [Centaurea solstitialis]